MQISRLDLKLCEICDDSPLERSDLTIPHDFSSVDKSIKNPDAYEIPLTTSPVTAFIAPGIINDYTAKNNATFQIYRIPSSSGGCINRPA